MWDKGASILIAMSPISNSSLQEELLDIEEATAQPSAAPALKKAESFSGELAGCCPITIPWRSVLLEAMIEDFQRALPAV